VPHGAGRARVPGRLRSVPGVYQVSARSDFSDYMYLGLLILSSHRLLPWSGHLGLMPFDWGTCSFGLVD
jgi:hypothetical protein